VESSTRPPRVNEFKKGLKDGTEDGKKAEAPSKDAT